MKRQSTINLISDLKLGNLSKYAGIYQAQNAWECILNDMGKNCSLNFDGSIRTGSPDFNYVLLEKYMSKTIYLLNAFSLQMMAELGQVNFFEIPELSQEELQMCVSAIGHQDTANVLGVQMNRINVSLNKGDTFIVAQLTGGRLPEGSTELPEGFKFKFIAGELL